MKSIKVVGTMDSLSRFFSATNFFQTRLGIHWLIDSSRKVTDSCYEITASENVKHAAATLQSIAIAAGCHVDFDV